MSNTEEARAKALRQIHDQPPSRVYTVAEVKEIVYPLLDALASRKVEVPRVNREDMADLIANTYANEFYDPAHKAADAVIAHLLPATEGAKK